MAAETGERLGPVAANYGNPDAIPANIWQAILAHPGTWGDLPAFDPSLTYGDVTAQQGFEGARGLAAQAAMGVFEPGPGQFAQMAAMIPRAALRALGRISIAGADGLPMPMYHGTNYVYDKPRPGSSGGGPGWYFTQDPERAARYAGSPAKDTGFFGGGSGRPDAAPNVRTGYVAGANLLDFEQGPFTPEQAQRIVANLADNPRTDPTFLRGVTRLADEGRLDPRRLYEMVYTYVPEPQVMPTMIDLGYSGWWDRVGKEGALYAPSRHFVQPWDGSRLLEVLQGPTGGWDRSRGIPMEEYGEAIRALNKFLNRGR